MGCHSENKAIPGEFTIFGETPDRVEEFECEGCKFNRPTKHNGRYVKIMDWDQNKVVRFVDLIESATVQTKSDIRILHEAKHK
jgi:hypothetical protein